MLPHLLIVHILILHNANGNFNCISRKSSVSAAGDDKKTSIGCSATFPTLISCGFSTKDHTEDDLDGGFMSSSSCTAQNGNGGAGVYAHARCCKFIPNDVQCFGFRSASYVQGDDAKQVTTCGESSYQFLTGCSSFSSWTSIDGHYPGTTSPHSANIKYNFDYKITKQACTAVNGLSGGGIYPSLSCCNSPTYSLSCVMRYGTASTLSIVTCSAGYAMVGCSGYGLYKNLNAWYITNDVCYARSYNNKNVYATAICCKIATDNPTPDPTNSPTTFAPTSAPTHTPNNDPTRAPTFQCPTLLVNVLKLDNQNISTSTWNGAYSLDEGNPTFGQIDWIGIDAAEGAWIKYFGMNWVISDVNSDVLTHEMLNVNDDYPPIGTFTWDHESIANGAIVNIQCSGTYSPTPSPTVSPTISPTHAPTTHFIGVFVTDKNDEIYHHWFHRKTTTELDGRSHFLYDIYPYRSTLSYDANNGWQLILFDNAAGTTAIYSSDMHGFYPPTNEWVLFGDSLEFYIEGLVSDWPTNSPTNNPNTMPPTPTPTNHPTSAPIMLPTLSPTASPSSAPTLYPTPVCNALIVNFPDGFSDEIAIKIFNSPFVYGGMMNKYYPYWTFDCDDEVDEYTYACNKGYVGMIYYNGNNVWLMSISSSADDYYKIYSTQSVLYFVPSNAIWVDTSTQNGISQQEYEFDIICGAALSSKPSVKYDTNIPTKTGKDTVDNTASIYRETWFAFSMMLLVLFMVILLVFGYCCYKHKSSNALMSFDRKSKVSEFEMREVINKNNKEDEGGESDEDDLINMAQTKKKKKKIQTKDEFVALESDDENDNGLISLTLTDGDGQTTRKQTTQR